MMQLINVLFPSQGQSTVWTNKYKITSVQCLLGVLSHCNVMKCFVSRAFHGMDKQIQDYKCPVFAGCVVTV